MEDILAEMGDFSDTTSMFDFSDWCEDLDVVSEESHSSRYSTYLCSHDSGEEGEASGYSSSFCRLGTANFPSRLSVQPQFTPMNTNTLPQVSVICPSMNVWRLERSRCVFLEGHHHGFFHEGGCYLILRVFDDRKVSLHYWLGNESKKHEREIIHEKAHEMDMRLEHAHLFSREVQLRESDSFLRLFPEGIIYVEGRPKGNVSYLYTKNLYIVQGRKFARASCNEPTIAAMDPTAAVILDGFPRIYVWVGSQSSYVSRMKAVQVARRIRNAQRKGIAHIVVIEDHEEELVTDFKKKLLNACDIKLNKVDENFNKSNPDLKALLYRLNGNSVMYDMPQVGKKPLEQKFLTRATCYLLSISPDHPLYVWVGNKTTRLEICACVRRGMIFSQHHGNLENQSVCRLLKGSEQNQFKAAFCDWKEKLIKPSEAAYAFDPDTVGRAMLSRSTRRDSEFRLPHDSSDPMGSTEIWTVKDGALEMLPADQYGIFENSRCFVVLNTYRDLSRTKLSLYYWLGSKSTEEDQNSALTLVQSKDESLNSKCVVVRVIDGKEPLIFFNVIHDTMIVYDKDESSLPSDVQLYAVIETSQACMRVQQESGGSEREYAKHMLGYLCPDKMFSYDLLVERKESDLFWDALGGKTEYGSKNFFDQGKRPGQRYPRMIHYSESSSGQPMFEEIMDFKREDLCEQEVTIMDTFDEIALWCGHYVDGDKRKCLAKIAKDYIHADVAGRADENVLVSFISQGAEPAMFTNLFQYWHNSEEHGGKEAFEMMRKEIRKENAKISIDVELIDDTHKEMKKYSYKQLMKPDLPSDVDPAHKEHNLSDQAFEEVLCVTRAQFYLYPDWKQQQMLASTHLDATPHESKGTSLTPYSPYTRGTLPRLSLDSFRK